jgi:hypothetical protein
MMASKVTQIGCQLWRNCKGCWPSVLSINIDVPCAQAKEKTPFKNLNAEPCSLFGWLRSSTFWPGILLSFIPITWGVWVETYLLFYVPSSYLACDFFPLPGSEMKTLVSWDVASLVVSCLLLVGKVGQQIVFQFSFLPNSVWIPYSGWWWKGCPLSQW